MSWGERSCKKPCRCPQKCTILTCNVSCKEYLWDGQTMPDSNPAQKSSCNHAFDGKVWYSKDGKTGSITCSKCGLPEIYCDLWNV